MNAGIHLAVPMADYVADRLASAPSLNAGTAHRLIAECPRSAWFHHARLNPGTPDESTQAQDVGSIVHAILLEGSTDCVAVIDPADYPAEKNGAIPAGWTNKGIRAARDQALDAGKIPVLMDAYAEIEAMVEAAEAFIAGSEIEAAWMDSDREAVMLYDEILPAKGNVWLRTRPDCLSKDRRTIIDVKTTQASADPDQWARTQLPGRNELQGAIGLRGLRVLAPDERTDPRVAFLVIEQNPPFLCSLVGMDPSAVALAQAKLDGALLLWQACIESGRWPGYPSRIAYPSPKEWQHAQWEEKAQGIPYTYEQLFRQIHGPSI